MRKHTLFTKLPVHRASIIIYVNDDSIREKSYVWTVGTRETPSNRRNAILTALHPLPLVYCQLVYCYTVLTQFSQLSLKFFFDNICALFNWNYLIFVYFRIFWYFCFPIFEINFRTIKIFNPSDVVIFMKIRKE